MTGSKGRPARTDTDTETEKLPAWKTWENYTFAVHTCSGTSMDRALLYMKTIEEVIFIALKLN